MPRLTAMVCARNEERRLGACLSRLAFADELVVVLDRCQDGSRRIALEHGAAIIEGIFPLEGPRRAAGAAAATGDWIFEVDADEEVSAALADEVRQAVEADDCDYRAIPVDNYVGGRLIRHGWGGSFGTTRVVRLFRSGVKSWGDQRVHPAVRLAGVRGPMLQAPLRHDVDDDISDMLARLDRYTALHAQDLADEGRVGGAWDNLFRGMRRFWKCYVRYQGWREGGWGFLIALMAGLYPVLSVLRAQLEAQQAVATVTPVEAKPEPIAALAP